MQVFSEFTSAVFPILIRLQDETQPEGSGLDEVLDLVCCSESAPNLKLADVLQAGDMLSDERRTPDEVYIYLVWILGISRILLNCGICLHRGPMRALSE